MSSFLGSLSSASASGSIQHKGGVAHPHDVEFAKVTDACTSFHASAQELSKDAQELSRDLAHLLAQAQTVQFQARKWNEKQWWTRWGNHFLFLCCAVSQVCSLAVESIQLLDPVLMDTIERLKRTTDEAGKEVQAIIAAMNEAVAMDHDADSLEQQHV
jgi:hypothetical protein